MALSGRINSCETPYLKLILVAAFYLFQHGSHGAANGAGGGRKVVNHKCKVKQLAFVSANVAREAMIMSQGSGFGIHVRAVAALKGS